MVATTRSGVCEAILDLLESIGLPALALDEKGLLLAANTLAAKLIAGGDVLTIVGARLSPVHPGDRASFSNALELKNDAVPAGHVVVLHRGPDKTPVFLRIVRPSAERDAIVLIVSDPFSTKRACPLCLRQLFRLTNREAELAALLASGHELKRAASDLNMSPGTARTHLRQIFQKTNTTTQAELRSVLLAASLGLCPSVVGSSDDHDLHCFTPSA